ncbi:MAG: GNAT family N-acetyltransferase [Gammaproteobacteria bacterium]|nr:GNAT family N-acetyltransferase [Gammaproteobacteria bacterium]MBT8437145.1 GNAT family N-acetyltransferase [Gammaproteobacteria bacterium]
MTPLVIETHRLKIRWLEVGDAAFIYNLVNDPTWIRYIGDKNVSNLEDAKTYIDSGPREMYRNLGFGLNHLSLKEDDTSIGICGLLQREALDEVEIGFALLSEFRGQGYAFEAATAVLEQGRTGLGISRIVAILTPDNLASRKLLCKLGFEFENSFEKESNQDKMDLYVFNG